MALTSVIIGRLNSEAEPGMDLAFVSSELSMGDSIEGMVSKMRDRMEDNVDPDTKRACSLMLSVLKDAKDIDDVRKTIDERLVSVKRTFDTHLRNAVEYMRSGFGNGQETVSLLVGLIDCYNVVMFSDPDGPLYGYNDELLSSGRNRRIMDMLEGA